MRYLLKGFLTEVPATLVGKIYKRDEVFSLSELPEKSQAFFSGQAVPNGLEWQLDKDNYPELVEIPKPTSEVLAANARSLRNARLQSLDKYLISDYPINAVDLASIKAYRKKLRDWPATDEFPDNMPELAGY